MLSKRQVQGGGRVFLLLPFLIFSAVPAQAVQLHGGQEGLILHQLGHILFAGGMLFLLILGLLNHWRGAGWGRFRCFLGLTVLWNILTFTGHWLRFGIDEGKFVRLGDKVVTFRVDSFADVVFYLASLDHLLLLPALIFLAVSLRQWKKDSEGDR